MAFAPDPTTGDLEAGLGAWQEIFGTLESSSLQAHTGSKSLRMTSPGGDTFLQSSTPAPPGGSSLVAVGAPTTVTIDGWAYTEYPIFETFQMVWQFYDSGGTPGTSSSVLEPVVIGNWVHLTSEEMVIDASAVFLRGVITAITTGGGSGITIGGEDVFWDDFTYSYEAMSIPLRKRQLSSRQFTVRRGRQYTP